MGGIWGGRVGFGFMEGMLGAEERLEADGELCHGYCGLLYITLKKSSDEMKISGGAIFGSMLGYE